MSQTKSQSSQDTPTAGREEPEGALFEELIKNPNLSEEKKSILKGKRLIGGGISAIILCGVLCGCFFPWLFFFFPLCIGCVMIEIFLKKKSYDKKKFAPPTEEELLTDEKIPTSNRKYDLVIFGATGFTGKLCANYVAKTYGTGKKLKWAIAGRSESRLKNVKESLTRSYQDAENLDCVIADTNNLDSLRKVVNNTRVIITTVGPYALYGTNLVGMCSAYGTHYCDITGEVPWVREMIIAYDDLARKSGACVISCCGADSIPWDLTTMSCAQKLKEKYSGEELKTITFVDRGNGAVSGGTLATIVNTVTNTQKSKSRLKFDPLYKLPGKDERSEYKIIIKNTFWPTYNKNAKAWTTISPQAGGNSRIVQRSNAILGYGKKMTYIEGGQFQGLIGTFNVWFGFVLFLTGLLTYPIRIILQKTVLPKQGEGPSLEAMQAGFLVATAWATGSNGNTVSQTITFYDDPGYRDTARMLVESGLCFIYNKNEIQVEGGFWTPASCQGKSLLKRLCDTGCDFQDNE